MDRKGQAAMEFLMTYGWAILIVLGAIAAIAVFVGNPSDLMGEKCEMAAGSGITCVDSTGTSSEVQLVLRNGAGHEMRDMTVTLEEPNGDTESTASAVNLSQGEQQTFSITGDFSGTYNADIVTEFTNAESGLNHTKSGNLVLKIE